MKALDARTQVIVDASLVGLGAILSQQQNDGCMLVGHYQMWKGDILRQKKRP